MGRMNFSPVGLVFYAPLYHQKLNTSPFLAWDIANGTTHSCTVTGAIWGLQGRTFGGNDDDLNCGSAASLFITNGTVELWVYPDDSADNRLLVDIRDGVAGDGYIQNIFSSLGISSGTPYVDTVQTSTLNPLAWHHVIVSGITFSGTGPLHIGQRYAGNYAWLGKIGEVRIYNRILIASERQNNYLSTKWRYT